MLEPIEARTKYKSCGHRDSRKSCHTTVLVDRFGHDFSHGRPSLCRNLSGLNRTGAHREKLLPLHCQT